LVLARNGERMSPRNRSFVRKQLSSNATRAALYARMSTDDKKCSIENQKDIMTAYAACHGLTIVRSYFDLAKSGLRIEGRPALKQLIHDVSF
jgi:DNA invertase Pin-like site-specific DNA recombinase